MIILSLIFYIQTAYSQTTLSQGTNINQTDNKGKKQGYWEKKYSNGKLQYKGFFRDDKPRGEFTRYYENGIIQAKMIFDDSGLKSHATLFYDNGEKAAEGNYVNTKKDST